jgi:hypothetical protein
VAASHGGAKKVVARDFDLNDSSSENSSMDNITRSMLALKNKLTKTSTRD